MHERQVCILRLRDEDVARHELHVRLLVGGQSRGYHGDVVLGDRRHFGVMQCCDTRNRKSAPSVHDVFLDNIA